MLPLKKRLKIKQAIVYGLLFVVLFFISLWFYGSFIFKDEIYERQTLSNAYPNYTANSENREQVQQGEYLTKLGNCITCHTNKKNDGKAFAGGLMINTPFGSVPSTNITPDNETGIGKWSKAQFIEAMTKGISPTGKHYYPAFPYLYFSNLTLNLLSNE